MNGEKYPYFSINSYKSENHDPSKWVCRSFELPKRFVYSLVHFNSASVGWQPFLCGCVCKCESMESRYLECECEVRDLFVSRARVIFSVLL